MSVHGRSQSDTDIGTDDERKSFVADLETAPKSRWRLHKVTLCLLMHIGLVIAHVVLLVVALKGWEQRLSVPPGKPSATLQTGLTIATSVFGALYTTLLLVYTQRLALRRNLLQSPTLTSLHDRTASWLGLGSALDILRKQSHIFNHSTITALYLLCIFGLHNTVPALLNVATVTRPVPSWASMYDVTPYTSGSAFFSSPDTHFKIPYQNLPSINTFPVTGLNGSMIHDIFDPHQAAPYNGTTAVVCVTTFKAVCEPMAASNVSQVEGLSWNISFPDGWSTVVSYSESQDSVMWPVLRIVPASASQNDGPPAVPYVTLLATWNITDVATGTSNDTLHFNLPNGPEFGSNSATWDLSFLKCGLSWSVRSGTIDSTSALVSVSDADGSCARTGWISAENSLNYNWTALWPQVVSWWTMDSYSSTPIGQNNPVDNVTLGIPEEYLMSTLGWDVSWGQNTRSVSPSLQGPPNIQMVSGKLGEMTAAIFRLAAQAQNSKLWSGSTAVRAQVEVTRGRLNISLLPAGVGLVLSALMTALVIVLFRDRDSVTKGMDNAGVLELAWLFSSSPIDYSPLKEVETTEERTLRNAGADIPWKGAVEEHWELHAARKRASKASVKV